MIFLKYRTDVLSYQYRPALTMLYIPGYMSSSCSCSAITELYAPVRGRVKDARVDNLVIPQRAGWITSIHLSSMVT